MKELIDALYNVDPDDPEPITDLIPPKILVLAFHLHNLIYIRAFYESLGQQPPVWTKGEMERAQVHLLKQLDIEQGQGGRFRRGERDEARQSRQEREGELEDRTPLARNKPRRRV